MKRFPRTNQEFRMQCILEIKKIDYNTIYYIYLISKGLLCTIHTVRKNILFLQYTSAAVRCAFFDPNWHEGGYFPPLVHPAKLIESFKKCPQVALKMTIFLFFIAHANEGSWRPALKSPIHVLHKFSVHSIFRLSSNFIVFLSGISQPCIQTYSFLRVCSFTCSKHNSFIILAACARQLQKIKQGRNRGLGAVHKLRQHI